MVASSRVSLFRDHHYLRDTGVPDATFKPDAAQKTQYAAGFVLRRGSFLCCFVWIWHVQPFGHAAVPGNHHADLAGHWNHGVYHASGEDGET